MNIEKSKIQTHTNSQKDGTAKDSTLDKINLDYDFNTEYGDGDIPDIDKPSGSSRDKETNT